MKSQHTNPAYTSVTASSQAWDMGKAVTLCWRDVPSGGGMDGVWHMTQTACMSRLSPAS